MRDVLYKKGMVIAIICLFVGAGFVPSAAENIKQTKSKN